MTKASYVLLMTALLSSAGKSVTLDVEAWNIESPASVLSSHEPSRELIRAMETNSNAVLLIRHASDEADRARAVALQAALVALGISSARLRLEPAAAAPRTLVLELTGAGSH